MPKQQSSDQIFAELISEQLIAPVLEGLTSDEVSRVAVDTIRDYRRRLDLVQSLEEQLEAAETLGQSDSDLQHKYRMALLELQIHHELVRIVIDVLGHIPQLPEDNAIQ